MPTWCNTPNNSFTPWLICSWKLQALNIKTITLCLLSNLKLEETEWHHQENTFVGSWIRNGDNWWYMVSINLLFKASWSDFDLNGIFLVDSVRARWSCWCLCWHHRSSHAINPWELLRQLDWSTCRDPETVSANCLNNGCQLGASLFVRFHCYQEYMDTEWGELWYI